MTLTDLSTFEEKLSHDRRWALAEGSQFFESKGSVQETLRRICDRLNQLKLPYAVCGGMALFAHGYRRFTEDVDLLVTDETAREIHDDLEGLGYIALFPGSRSLRDADSKVRIEFFITGQFPGDGKPKPVSFPDPSVAFVELDGIRYLSLAKLIELKLASGITAPSRLKDLADVLELIKTLALPESFADQLNEFVTPKFRELWHAAQS